MTPRVAGNTTVQIATYIWVMTCLLGSIGALFIGLEAAGAFTAIAATVIPFLSSWVRRSVTPQLTKFQASSSGLRVGDRSFPWDTVTAIDVPAGVKGIRVQTTTEEVLIKLTIVVPFAELEWAASCIRHVMEDASASGTEVDIPQQLRATQQAANQCVVSQ